MNANKLQISDVIANINKVFYPKLGNGSCTTIKEVYDQVIEMNRLDPNVVIGWWKVLKRYVEDEGFVGFVRMYEHKYRRGFLTCFGNVAYAYVGNAFAEYFLTMAKAQFVPHINEFKNFIQTRRMPHGYREDRGRGENPAHQAFTCGRTPMMGRKGWYLAHIFSVDDPKDYQALYSQLRTGLFKVGDLHDWYVHDGDDFPMRCVNRDLDQNELSILRAHFLRLVNPMNYFLVPKANAQRLVVNGRVYKSGIGSLKEMIEFMRGVRRKEFGSFFAEFEEMSMCCEPQRAIDIQRLGEGRIDLKFGGVYKQTVEPTHIDARKTRVDAKTWRQNGEERIELGTTNAIAPTIELYPAGIAEFKNKLLRTRRAERTLIFADGRRIVQIWRANKFTAETDLMKNIKTSTYYKNWRRNGLVKVIISVKD